MTILDNLPRPFFILAPMDDVTDTVFRQVVAGSAKPDLFFTEFVNVDGLQSPGRERLLHKLKFTSSEQPLIAQLWGLKPENYYKTVRELVDGSLIAEANFVRSKDRDSAQGKSEQWSEAYTKYDEMSSGAFNTAMDSKHGGVAGFAGQQAGAVLSFAGVDINMGCPVRTVIKNGACAALIKNQSLAGEIIAAVQEAAGKDFPVSVKTRVGFTTPDTAWLEFLLLKKLDMLSIHARTAAELSKVPANWDLVGEARQMRDALCPSTLIVGNGDVMSRHEGLELALKHKLDGVMIGRGIFSDPFIFSGSSPWEQWSKEQKIGLFKNHIQLYIDSWPNNERKFETLRKFCKVYINGFDGASELRAKFMETKNPGEALDLLN